MARHGTTGGEEVKTKEEWRQVFISPGPSLLDFIAAIQQDAQRHAYTQAAEISKQKGRMMKTLDQGVEITIRSAILTARDNLTDCSCDAIEMNAALLDAFKAGMTECAEMVRNQGLHGDFHFGHKDAKELMASKIEAARDNLTTP